MSQAINAFNAALAVSCLALSACGGDSSGETTSSANSDNMKAAATVTQASASISGTRIPSAKQIVDSSGNVWTVASGVIYENGKLAGYSNAVTLLVYDNKTIYQENSAGGWWSWSGGTWVSSSDPLKAASASGTSIPKTTQIVDSSGNIWVVSGGVIYENGALAGYSNAVTSLVYDNNTIYQENSAGGWWSWSGGTWVGSSDPLKAASASGTSIPKTTQIVDSSGNIWVVSGGVIYENGALAGYSNAVTALVYENNTIYQENTAGGWWSWSGGTWVGSSDPLTVTTSGGGSGTTTTTGTASVSWDAPTQDTNGEALTDLAGYTIYYGTSASALTKTIQVANPGATNYVVSNLSAGTYYFAVAAYTTTGTVSAQSAVHSKTIP